MTVWYLYGPAYATTSLNFGFDDAFAGVIIRQTFSHGSSRLIATGDCVVCAGFALERTGRTYVDWTPVPAPPPVGQPTRRERLALLLQPLFP